MKYLENYKNTIGSLKITKIVSNLQINISILMVFYTLKEEINANRKRNNIYERA